MRFMIIVKGDEETEGGALPSPDAVAEMAEYHEELHRAGVLVDASGLQPSGRGFRIRYNGDKRTVVDGPFAETKELVAGYTVIRVKSREEALEWAMRFPRPAPGDRDCEIEIRQMFDLDDFEASEGVERFRELGVGGM